MENYNKKRKIENDFENHRTLNNMLSIHSYSKRESLDELNKKNNTLLSGLNNTKREYVKEIQELKKKDEFNSKKLKQDISIEKLSETISKKIL